MYSNFEVDSKSVIDSDVYNLLLFDQNYFHFLSSVWNFPVQCSLKGPFSSSFLSACKKRYIRPSFETTFLYHCIFGILILSHFCCRGLVSRSIRICYKLSLSLFTSSYFRVKGFSFLCISIVLPTCTTHYLTKIFTCVCDLYSVRKRERRFIQIYTSSFIVYASVDFCSLQSDVVSGLKKANKFSKIVSIFVMNKNK